MSSIPSFEKDIFPSLPLKHPSIIDISLLKFQYECLVEAIQWKIRVLIDYSRRADDGSQEITREIPFEPYALTLDTRTTFPSEWRNLRRGAFFDRPILNVRGRTEWYEWSKAWQSYAFHRIEAIKILYQTPFTPRDDFRAHSPWSRVLISI